MADFLTQAWPFAAAILVILGIVALAFLVIILFRVMNMMKSVQGMVEEAEKEVTPALAKVNPMVDKAELLVDTVNLEMLRVDAILEDVEQISNVAGKTANTVDTVASAPAEAVTSLVDRIRGTIGGKRSDKLKQSRVVYPIGSGKDDSDPAAEEVMSEVNEDAIKEAAQAVADETPKPKDSASGKSIEDTQPLGKHSVDASAQKAASQEDAS